MNGSTDQYQEAPNATGRANQNVTVVKIGGSVAVALLGASLAILSIGMTIGILVLGPHFIEAKATSAAAPSMVRSQFSERESRVNADQIQTLRVDVENLKSRSPK